MPGKFLRRRQAGREGFLKTTRGRAFGRRKERRPFALSLRNAHAALQIADMAYVLENGSIVKQGTGTELLGDAAIHEAYLGG